MSLHASAAPPSFQRSSRDGRDAGAIDLYGHGQIGSALTALLRQRGIQPRSITTSRGAIQGSKRTLPDVAIDCTPPRYTGKEAEDWVAYLEHRLEEGVHVVTCNKAPLAVAGARLEQAATRGEARILASATVGGGSPLVPFFQRLDRSLGVSRIDVCASGTLGFVLDQVVQGESLDRAVEQAQELGYAEPDPRLDLDGTDLAAKAVLLHNGLVNVVHKVLDAHEAPFLDLSERRIRRIAEAGGIPRVVAVVCRDRIELQVQDTPWAGRPEDAVARIETIDGSRFLMRGPGAGPHVTAGNLLADLEMLSHEVRR